MIFKKHFDSLREHQYKILSDEFEIKQLCAKDAMIKPVFLYPNDEVDVILKKLRKEHINVCVVVSKEKKFLGEITDGDVIKLFLQQVKCEPLVKILNRDYRREFLYKTAFEMINKHDFCVGKDTPINDIILLIWKEGFKYIPVLDKNDVVMGVVTPSSIINLLKDYWVCYESRNFC